ncbi:MAG: hypothetical protein NTW29_01680 [Bacteroidetes bacterium]|nr:hypothetical protein [Bacteroidota bacterium]
MGEEKELSFEQVKKIMADAAKRVDDINKLIDQVPQDTPSPSLKPPGTPPGNKAPGSRAQRISFLNEQKTIVITTAREAVDSNSEKFSQVQKQELTEIVTMLTNPDAKRYDAMITDAQHRAISKIKDYRKHQDSKTYSHQEYKEQENIPELTGMGSKFIESLSYSSLKSAEQKQPTKEKKEIQSTFAENKKDLFEER